MEINKARRLQKILFKQSNARFKRTRTNLYSEKLFYIILHNITNEAVISITEKNIDRIKEALSFGVETTIEYITHATNPNIPEGMYAIEYILVD